METTTQEAATVSIDVSARYHVKVRWDADAPGEPGYAILIVDRLARRVDTWSHLLYLPMAAARAEDLAREIANGFIPYHYLRDGSCDKDCIH